NPRLDLILSGPALPNFVGVDVYSEITGPTSFGSGGFTAAGTGSGDTVGIFGNQLYVPERYQSCTQLKDKSTYSGQTITSLGLTPGTYTWTWGTGAHADSFVLVIPSPENAQGNDNGQGNQNP